jgi:hypothetical protein
MNISNNNFDSLEKIIFEDGLKIEGVNFYPEIDLMIVVLNNRKVITSPISIYQLLKDAKLNQLNNYKLIANGVGIHWEELDEDISLKGLLKQSISNGNISLVA